MQRSWENGGNVSAKYMTNEMLAPFTANGTGGGMPTSQVEMSLSCRNLINKDVISKSDPFCVIWMKESWQERYFEIGRTEVIDDNLNPEWVKSLVLNYNFETVQKLKFEVWDLDVNGQDFLGRFETTLADIVSHSGRQFVGNLVGISQSAKSQIVIVTEEVSSCKQIAKIHFQANELTKMSWFVKNDPFLVLSRSNEDGSYSVIAKTEVLYWTQNPRWRPMILRVTTLCNGDYDRNIKIDCYDSRRNGSHKLIGTCFATLRALLGSPEQRKLPLLNPRKRKSNADYSNSGIVQVLSIEIMEEVTFLDYIRNGTQLHFAVAIDFTASNGDSAMPKSLHHLSSQRPNNYEVALRSVGEIIQSYDSSHLFPAFGTFSTTHFPSNACNFNFVLLFGLGFGAKLPPTWSVSHQFPLNGNPSHPYCSSVEEILVHYRTRVNSVTFYGPTNFSPVINNTIAIAEQFQDGKHYFILLIITDGIISDMHQTKHAIVHASRLPISIIIVGVGDADFDAMDELDSDDSRLTVDGLYAERDIVQFVPLNKFLSKTGPYIKSQADLAREVLAEVPEQLTGFMKSKGYKPDLPKPPVAQDPHRAAATAPRE